MSVCMYVCVCVCVCMYVCIYECMYVCMCVCVCMHVCVYMYVCMYVSMTGCPCPFHSKHYEQCPVVPLKILAHNELVGRVIGKGELTHCCNGTETLL